MLLSLIRKIAAYDEEIQQLYEEMEQQIKKEKEQFLLKVSFLFVLHMDTAVIYTYLHHDNSMSFSQ